MENSEKIESLKFMSDAHRREFCERRRYEIKIVLTVVTFYVLAGYSRFNEYFPENLPCWFDAIIWSAFILLAIVSSIFLWFVHNANYSNKTIAERAEDAIEKLIKDEKVTIDLFKKPFVGRAQFKWASWIWQILTIFLFACSSAVILTLI